MRGFQDIGTKARIKLALMSNPYVGGLEIRVDVVNGIVFLTGAVQDIEKKLLAEKIARLHGGIDIRNDISVLGDFGMEMDDSIHAQAYQDDAALLKRILGDMESDERINVVMLNIEVSGSIVYLSGVQDTEDGRNRAAVIAARVPGVVSVENDIKVRRAG